MSSSFVHDSPATGAGEFPEWWPPAGEEYGSLAV